MKQALVAIVAVVALAHAAAPSFAQAPPAGATTNMDILAAKLKADKKLLVAQTVGLTDAEGQAFWPIYDACQAELQVVNKRLAAAIAAYAKEYNANTMTDAKAAALTAESFAVDEALLAAKKSCAAKLTGVIPAAKIARYVQVENKIRAQVNYELAASIPFVQ